MHKTQPHLSLSTCSIFNQNTLFTDHKHLTVLLPLVQPLPRSYIFSQTDDGRSVLFLPRWY